MSCHSVKSLICVGLGVDNFSLLEQAFDVRTGNVKFDCAIGLRTHTHRTILLEPECGVALPGVLRQVFRGLPDL